MSRAITSAARHLRIILMSSLRPEEQRHGLVEQIPPDAEHMPARIVRPARVDAALLQQTDDALSRREHTALLPAAPEKEQLQALLRLRRVREHPRPRLLCLDRLGRRLRSQGSEAAAVREHGPEQLGVRQSSL